MSMLGMLSSWDLITFSKYITDYVTKDSFSKNYHHMISLQGFYSQIANFFPSFTSINLFSIITSLAVISLTILTIRKIKPNSSTFPIAYGLIIITTLLVGYHVHLHEALLLLFPFFFYYKQLTNTPNQTKFYLIVALGWITFFLYFLSIHSTDFSQPIPFIPTLYLILIFFLNLKYLRSILSSQGI